jgi:hypothetical protein
MRDGFPRLTRRLRRGRLIPAPARPASAAHCFFMLPSAVRFSPKVALHLQRDRMPAFPSTLRFAKLAFSQAIRSVPATLLKSFQSPR